MTVFFLRIFIKISEPLKRICVYCNNKTRRGVPISRFPFTVRSIEMEKRRRWTVNGQSQMEYVVFAFGKLIFIGYFADFRTIKALFKLPINIVWHISTERMIVGISDGLWRLVDSRPRSKATIHNVTYKYIAIWWNVHILLLSYGGNSVITYRRTLFIHRPVKLYIIASNALGKSLNFNSINLHTALFNTLTAMPIIWISNEPAKIWYGKLKQSRQNRDNNFNCHQTFYLHFNIRIVHHITEYFFLISFRLTSHFRINFISFLTTTNNGNLSLRPKTTRRMHH